MDRMSGVESFIGATSHSQCKHDPDHSGSLPQVLDRTIIVPRVDTTMIGENYFTMRNERIALRSEDAEDGRTPSNGTRKTVRLRTPISVDTEITRCEMHFV